jgi:hypothetical protein
VAAPVSSGDLPSTGAELVLHEDERSEGLGFFALGDETDPLDLFMDRPDVPSENGGHGLRRFILLVLLFGAILRYLTSTTFCKWAADVFDPLGGY